MKIDVTSKLISMDDLTVAMAEARSRGQKIVHSHGIFDRLHVGHFRHLRQAKQMGDILVVTIYPDRYADVDNIGGSINEKQRAEALSLLEWVDFVAIDREASIEQALQKILPDIFVSGREELRDFRLLTDQGELTDLIEKLGITKAYTEDGLLNSRLLHQNSISDFSEEIKKYIKIFKSRYSLDEIFDLIEQMKSLDVFVIGDTILDEYFYCNTLGASSKDPTLAVQYESHERFAGGILAIANHIANFSNKVHLVTVIGDNREDEIFIRSKLNSNIKPHFIVKQDAPTLIKRRIVEPNSLQKLLEIYIMDDSGPGVQQENELADYIKKKAVNFNLCIAGDFGHGAITEKIRQALVESAPFLAVNTQANAGNKRIHTISRYPRADFVSIAEHELRMETRDLKGDVRPMVQHLQKKLESRAFLVTRGNKGSCIAHGKKGAYTTVPAFAQSVVDRIGAGDACFSISALAAYLNAPDEIIAFIGNVVGALSVGIVGNKSSVKQSDVKEYISQFVG